ncbi:hypothetical protein [Risungbinella massiliensis]|uniref:hypothetical protein n=1 Tax=Risungbinella massiliensis TaxID=1329796 RepID=UPI0005CC3C7A|nr:hypothetical protein [Risungbinella massiliensis]
MFILLFTLFLVAFFYATIHLERWILSRYTLSYRRKKLLEKTVVLILSAIFTMLLVLLLNLS